MTSEQFGTRTRVGYAAQSTGFADPYTVVHDQHTQFVVNHYVYFDPARVSMAGAVGESFSQHCCGLELDGQRYLAVGQPAEKDRRLETEPFGGICDGFEDPGLQPRAGR